MIEPPARETAAGFFYSAGLAKKYGSTLLSTPAARRSPRAADSTESAHATNSDGVIVPERNLVAVSRKNPANSRKSSGAAEDGLFVVSFVITPLLKAEEGSRSGMAQKLK